MVLRIGKDLDGPNHSFGQGVREFLKSQGKPYGWKDGADEPHHWNFYEYWNMTTEEFVQMCHEGVEAGYIFTGNIRPHAKEAWHEVMRYGDIIVITDRQFGKTPETSHKVTEAWLYENELWFDELWFTADKTVTWTDIMIEDKLENYDALEKAGTESWLINYPWNQVEGGDSRRRIDSMREWPAKVRAKYNKTVL